MIAPGRILSGPSTRRPAAAGHDGRSTPPSMNGAAVHLVPASPGPAGPVCRPAPVPHSVIGPGTAGSAVPQQPTMTSVNPDPHTPPQVRVNQGERAPTATLATESASP